jgi:hypothetical protein
MKLKNIGTYYVCIYCQHPNYRQNVVIQIAENNNVDTDLSSPNNYRGIRASNPFKLKMSTFRAHVFFLVGNDGKFGCRHVCRHSVSMYICMYVYVYVCVFMYVCTSIIDLRTQEYESEKWTQFFVNSRCSSPTNHLDHWEIMPVITASAINNLSGQFRF